MGAGCLSPAEDERFPRTDLDHYVNADRLNAFGQETIPEEDEDEATMEMGAQEGIVDDDLEVNATKQQQLRQGLLSMANSSPAADRGLATKKGKQAGGSWGKIEEFQAEQLAWVKLVIEFFELHYMAIIERKKALRIERFFCNLRRMKVRATFNAYIHKMHGFSMTFDKLPRGIGLLVLSYLTRRENMAVVSGLSCRFRSLARDASCWRTIAIQSHKE